MKLNLKDYYTLNDHHHFFTDPPFIKEIGVRSFERIQESIDIIKRYPSIDQTIIYRLEAIKSGVNDNMSDLDFVHRTIGEVPRLLRLALQS